MDGKIEEGSGIYTVNTTIIGIDSPNPEETKGQSISDCLLGVINFPKNQWKIWQISALESKKWSNQQGKSTFIH